MLRAEVSQLSQLGGQNLQTAQWGLAGEAGEVLRTEYVLLQRKELETRTVVEDLSEHLAPVDLRKTKLYKSLAVFVQDRAYILYMLTNPDAFERWALLRAGEQGVRSGLDKRAEREAKQWKKKSKALGLKTKKIKSSAGYLMEAAERPSTSATNKTLLTAAATFSASKEAAAAKPATVPTAWPRQQPLIKKAFSAWPKQLPTKAATPANPWQPAPPPAQQAMPAPRDFPKVDNRPAWLTNPTAGVNGRVGQDAVVGRGSATTFKETRGPPPSQGFGGVRGGGRITCRAAPTMVFDIRACQCYCYDGYARITNPGGKMAFAHANRHFATEPVTVGGGKPDGITFVGTCNGCEMAGHMAFECPWARGAVQAGVCDVFGFVRDDLVNCATA